MPKIPGPWYCLTGHSEVTGEVEIVITNTTGPHWPAPEHWVGQVSVDNAQLIAAAPELLSALRGALEWLENLAGDMVSHWGTEDGLNEFIDHMPNNIRGREAMLDLVKRAES